MNEDTSDECLQYVVSKQMVIFRAFMEQVSSASDGEATFCAHLVFLKRFALLNESAGKHLVAEDFPTELIKIAGNAISCFFLHYVTLHLT